MPRWTIHRTAQCADSGLAGLELVDATGVRLGFVRGWVTDASGQIAFLEVAVTGTGADHDSYLLPLHYVCLVCPERGFLQVNKLRRTSLISSCPRSSDDLDSVPDLDAISNVYAPPNAEIRDQIRELTGRRTVTSC